MEMEMTPVSKLDSEGNDTMILMKDQAEAANSVPPTDGTPAAPRSDHEDNDELLKQYYFGCGPFHPKWLQFLANKKFFTLLACCFTCLHSSIVSGYISVILSTIQTRYQFSSVEVSFVVIAYDLSVAIGITFTTYFANRFHKPRILGISCILLGINSLLYASPQFIFGEYQIGSSTFLNEQCLDNRTIVLDCESTSSNGAALFIFIFSSVILSISSSVLYTLAVVYIDEIVFPRYVPLHIGSFNTFLVLGPTFGFLIGSSCLSIYVDPWVDTALTESDPAWVGAWWIPFILVALFAFLLSIPFLMFPKWLPDTHLVREERKKEMAKVFVDDKVDRNNTVVFVKTFAVQMWRLCTNISLMCSSFGLAIIYVFSQGVISFGPQYLENQFHLSSSVAGFTTGGIAIPGAVVGVIIGSVLTYSFKWNGKQNMLFVTVVTFVNVPFLLAYLIHCPTVSLAGVTTHHGNQSTLSSVDTSLSCNSNCNCTSSVFEPVCGNDGITYFSACRAGCTGNVMDTDLNYDYENCSCVLSETSSSGLHGGGNSTATVGLCESTCILIVPMIILFFMSVVLSFIATIPYQYYTIRVVSDEQRALAIGLQSAIWRVFGAVPGPILFGGLFDLSCAVWQEECGRRGNCWLYHNDELSNRATAVALPCIGVGGVLFLIAFLTYPKNRIT